MKYGKLPIGFVTENMMKDFCWFTRSRTFDLIWAKKIRQPRAVAGVRQNLCNANSLLLES
jgi:hypothetical protein